MKGPFSFILFVASAATAATQVNARVNSQVNVMASPYNATGDCVTDDSGAISAAMAAGWPEELYLPKAPGGCYLVNTPPAVSAGATITFAPGAVVKTPTKSTWTFSGKINAGRWQIFNSGDRVSFYRNAALREVYPEWWGADPTGTVASAVAWQDAVNAVQRVNGLGGTVSCPSATYLIENTVTSFAPDTASGVSLLGPDSQNNASWGACSLKWTGPVGGTVFHYIGGHQGVIKNVTFNANGIASRGLWLDSANGAASTSTAITSVVRSCQSGTSCTTGQGNIVTVTTATVPGTGWASGTDITLAGVSDTSFNGVFPVWYRVDATHYVFSQGGPLASSSGGTASTIPSGDIAGIKLEHVEVYSMASQTASVSSCAVASSVETCTVSAPVLMYPNEWTWISHSFDPSYNAYWKLTGVNSATGFTATASEVSSEASTSSGAFQGPSSGISFGSNQFSLMNNSVCCTDFDGIQVNGIGISPTPLIAYEWDGSSNTKDFQLKNAVSAGARIGFAAFGTGGNFYCDNCGGISITDALYAASVLGVAHIANTEWEQIGTAYVLASLPSGSYNAAILGTSGQFELNNSSGGTIEMDNVRVESTTFAPDGVAISTGGNLILRGNSIGYVGDTVSHVTSIVTATPGSAQTPGTYTLNAKGGGGTGAQISVVVASSGTVTQAPTIISQGIGYTSAPTFTLSAGGTAATFRPTLGLSTPLINTGTYFSSGIPSSLTSIGNTYYNVPAGGWVPVIDRTGGGNYPAYGSGSRLGGSPITTFGDFGSTTSGNLFRLSEGSTLTELRYAAPPSGTPLDDASVGFPKLPNNVPGPAWRNAVDNSDCWEVLDIANALDLDCGALESPTVHPFTTQGNTFNGNNQLVQTGSTGKVPASVLPLGTASAPGAVRCDGSTTTCSGGVVTAVGAKGTPRTILFQNTNTVVNSTPSEGALFTGMIPANTLGPNSNIHWTATFTGETSAGTCTFKAYLNTSTAFGGDTLLVGNALAVGSRQETVRGDIWDANSMSVQGGAYTYNYKPGGTANDIVGNNNVNMAATSYFIVTATPSSATADSTGCVLNSLHVMLWP